VYLTLPEGKAGGREGGREGGDVLVGYAHRDFASELTLLLQGEGGGGVKVRREGRREGKGREGGKGRGGRERRGRQ